MLDAPLPVASEPLPSPAAPGAPSQPRPAADAASPTLARLERITRTLRQQIDRAASPDQDGWDARDSLIGSIVVDDVREIVRLYRLRAAAAAADIDTAQEISQTLVQPHTAVDAQARPTHVPAPIQAPGSSQAGPAGAE